MKPWHAASGPPTPVGVFICATLLVCFLAGCASSQVAGLSQAWPADLPEHVELKSTPFFAQADYECGPAALAMTLSAAGVPTTPEALVPQVYLPARKASLQIEMPVAVRRAGLLAYPLQPQLHSILQELAAGHPVVVFQNLSFPWYPVWHYAVVIGYDRDTETLLLHSGTTPRMTISLSAFERTWARGQYWAMLALQPDQLPASGDANQLAAALVALERVNAKAAAVGYQAALGRWPLHQSFLLGLGNATYAQSDLPAAQVAYASATQLLPDFADAWNNLAQVLLEQGQLAQAKTAIDRAVALGGPRLRTYLELQTTIAASQ
jgi:tetratricopeptide (TPR) repeat protein